MLVSDPIYIPKILNEVGKYYNRPVPELINLRQKIKKLAGFNPVNITVFRNELNQLGSLLQVVFSEKSLNWKEIEGLLKNQDCTVILFVKNYNFLEPIILYPYTSDGGYKVFEISADVVSNTQSLSDYFQEKGIVIAENNEGEMLSLIPINNESYFTDLGKTEVLSPFKRFIRFVKLEQRDIFHIYTFAILSGIISLSLPIGIQAIVSLVSASLVINSAFVIVGIIIIGILVSGAIQIAQMNLIESMQQRIFAKLSFEFIRKLTQLPFQLINNKSLNYETNKFFDVLTIQKGSAKILLDLTTSSMQILFGLILLSLYHPLLSIFGVVCFLLLILYIRLTAISGLNSSLSESKYKYKIAFWIQEYARSLFSFKSVNASDYSFQKTDELVSHYIHYRTNHFKILQNQYRSLVFFRSLITTGILLLGIYFVYSKVITLAQFVSAEIVIVLISSAVEKLIFSIDNVYDVLTAAEKIGKFSDFESEKIEGITLSERDLKKPIVVFSEYKLFENQVSFSAQIPNASKVFVSGINSDYCAQFMSTLKGHSAEYLGNISLNELPYRSVEKSSIRAYISSCLKRDKLFDGTIEENIRLGREEISLNDVLLSLEKVGLLDWVNKLPNGLETEVENEMLGLSRKIKAKILIARAIVRKPKFLLIDFDITLEHEFTSNLLNNEYLKNCTVFYSSDKELITEVTTHEIFISEEQITSNELLKN